MEGADPRDAMSDDEDEDIEENDDVEEINASGGGGGDAPLITFSSACAEFDAWMPEDDDVFLTPIDAAQPRQILERAAAATGAAVASEGEGEASLVVETNSNSSEVMLIERDRQVGIFVLWSRSFSHTLSLFLSLS